jgi:hypothetical protein
LVVRKKTEEEKKKWAELKCYPAKSSSQRQELKRKRAKDNVHWLMHPPSMVPAQDAALPPGLECEGTKAETHTGTHTQQTVQGHKIQIQTKFTSQDRVAGGSNTITYKR